MTMQLLEKRRTYLLVDIDTQRNFLLAGDNASKRNHAKILANIRRAMSWDWHKNIPIISTVEIYHNNGGHFLSRR